ncbi:MAG: 30S ribosomal protein S16 [Candidatus Woesebacteria bacterium]|jgi:small subunit ribosomal protein S16
MIKIRLSRRGAKNAPFYRIVAIEHTRKREGKPVDVLGHWHPSKNVVKIDKKRIKEWVGKGAKVSKAVKELLEK